MKIEKISDTQIRCTLNKNDLLERELKISELAYGTEKAKSLFRDMMMQASFEFGFEADDIPLMIEAIPSSRETLILVITKVEDPDELDTRFSRFSPDSTEMDEELEVAGSYPDEILQCFDQLNDLLQDKKETIEEDNFIPLPEALGLHKKAKDVGNTKTNTDNPADISKIYVFSSLRDILQLAEQVTCLYRGENSAYKNPLTGLYYLIIHKSNHTSEEFNKVCNLISEYGRLERATYATPAYFKEHFECIVKKDALQILSVL